MNNVVSAFAERCRARGRGTVGGCRTVAKLIINGFLICCRSLERDEGDGATPKTLVIVTQLVLECSALVGDETCVQGGVRAAEEDVLGEVRLGCEAESVGPLGGDTCAQGRLFLCQCVLMVSCCVALRRLTWRARVLICLLCERAPVFLRMLLRDSVRLR